MKIVVWVVSALLALFFLAVGVAKLISPADVLEESAGGVPIILLRIAGTAEVLGALGLILPAVTRILPILTPLAGGGLVLVMVGATITNIIIGQYVFVLPTVVLGVIAGLVAWARFTSQAIEPRGAAQPT